MTPQTDGQSLIEFAFVSSLAAALEPSSILRLARQTWRHNTEAGLTGEMVIRDGEVRQVVEGRLDRVLPLASRILSDPRHGGIRVIAFGPIARRRHGGWRVHGLAAPHAAPEVPAAANDTVLPLAVAVGAQAGAI